MISVKASYKQVVSYRHFIVLPCCHFWGENYFIFSSLSRESKTFWRLILAFMLEIISRDFFSLSRCFYYHNNIVFTVMLLGLIMSFDRYCSRMSFIANISDIFPKQEVNYIALMGDKQFSPLNRIHFFFNQHIRTKKKKKNDERL